MKKLHLIRHAKSSWGDPTLADIERPLNKRGIKTCRFMAQYIYEAGCPFKNVFCSPAVRAQSTIQLIDEALPDIDINWKTEKDLYGCGMEDLLQWCQALNDSMSEILIIGHNPTFTDFCNYLSKSHISNIPTCGYVQLTVTENCNWQQLKNGSAELSTFLQPKEMME